MPVSTRIFTCLLENPKLNHWHPGEVVRSKSNHPPKKNTFIAVSCFFSTTKKGLGLLTLHFLELLSESCFFSREVSNGVGQVDGYQGSLDLFGQGKSPSLLIQKSCQLSQLRYRSLRALNRRFNLTPNSGKIWPVDSENVLDIKKFWGHWL